MKYSDVEEMIKGSENEKLEGDNVIEREDRLEDDSTDYETANDFLELHVESWVDIGGKWGGTKRTREGESWKDIVEGVGMKIDGNNEKDKPKEEV